MDKKQTAKKEIDISIQEILDSFESTKKDLVDYIKRLDAHSEFNSRNKDAVEILGKAFKDADVRTHAILGKIGIIQDPRPIEPLIDVLRDKDPKVRSVAIDMFSYIFELTDDQLNMLPDRFFDFLANVSLAVNISDEFQRYIPLRVYLQEGSTEGETLIKAIIDDFCQAFRLEIVCDQPAIIGSIWKTTYTRTKDAITHPEAIERLKKLERVSMISIIDGTVFTIFDRNEIIGNFRGELTTPGEKRILVQKGKKYLFAIETSSLSVKSSGSIPSGRY